MLECHSSRISLSLSVPENSNRVQAITNDNILDIPYSVHLVPFGHYSWQHFINGNGSISRTTSSEGSKSNIPCCALLARQVRATFAYAGSWRTSYANLASTFVYIKSCSHGVAKHKPGVMCQFHLTVPPLATTLRKMVTQSVYEWGTCDIMHAPDSRRCKVPQCFHHTVFPSLSVNTQKQARHGLFRQCIVGKH
jgi:hypothetical protein